MAYERFFHFNSVEEDKLSGILWVKNKTFIHHSCRGGAVSDLLTSKLLKLALN